MEQYAESLAVLIRKHSRVPTINELRVAHHDDPTLPSEKTLFSNGKRMLVERLLTYYSGKPNYADVASICERVLTAIPTRQQEESASDHSMLGVVYLYKHDREYKIGKTFDPVRRGKELRIQLPKDLEPIHEIKTDDPSGVEAYSHRRFADKRMNGEWFNLNSSDVRAFKRWRKIF